RTRWSAGWPRGCGGTAAAGRRSVRPLVAGRSAWGRLLGGRFDGGRRSCILGNRGGEHEAHCRALHEDLPLVSAVSRTSRLRGGTRPAGALLRAPAGRTAVPQRLADAEGRELRGAGAASAGAEASPAGSAESDSWAPERAGKSGTNR